MALSKGSLHATEMTLESLNDALRRIREELDELHGLRGASTFYGAKTIQGQTTIQGAALRLLDADGNLVHACGTKE